MPQLLLIVVFLLISAPSMLGLPEPTPDLPAWRAIAWTLTLHAALCIPAWIVVARCVRTVDRTGSMRAVRTGDRATLLLRWASVVIHGLAIFALGWAHAVRQVVGDLIMLDEFLCAAPVLAVWAFSWWIIEPLERRLREAVLLRQLDAGAAVHPVLSRGRYVWMTIRHQVLILLVPMLAIMAWSEGVEWWARNHLPGADPAVPHPEDWRVVIAQLSGVAAVFVIMPGVLTRIWDTVPLGPGAIRERVDALCRGASVRVREILVWRTSGLVVNAAAVGLIRPLRYILLSDALLDHLPQRQVEAVAAHEMGHVRRRHMLWLGIVMLATLMGASALADGAITACRRLQTPPWFASLSDEAIGPWLLGAMLMVAVLVFGFVSRRFEWQADAFAVQCLSREGTGDETTPGSRHSITAEAVGAMSSALASVASLSGLPRERFSWRHGSIATRQRKLTRLAGRAIDRLPIDAHARWIKLASLAVLAASIAWAFLAPESP